MKNYILLLLLACFMPALSFARPVSYPGGWTIMQKNHEDESSLHTHYSPTKDYSIGYFGEYWSDEDVQMHSVKLNYLAKRWNAKASQGNLYFTGGVGTAISNNGHFNRETEALTYGGLMADWEDRRYFVSYANKAIYAGDIDQSFHQKARVGIAPYIGDYGDIHTWLMLQVDHHPEEKDNFKVTPLVRFFYDVNLLEVGVNEDGDVLAHFIYRF